MAEIAQKGCLLEGVTHLISITPADLAVLLHSDPDCANLVLSDSRAVDPTRFFCTNIEERDVIGGTSSARLEEAIRWVVKETSTPPSSSWEAARPPCSQTTSRRSAGSWAGT